MPEIVLQDAKLGMKSRQSRKTTTKVASGPATGEPAKSWESEAFQFLLLRMSESVPCRLE